MNIKETPPTFIVNPLAAKKSLWFPKMYQLLTGRRNPNYLNSLWLGVGFSIVSIPQMVKVSIYLLSNNLALGLLSLIQMPSYVMGNIYYGITGRLMGLDIDIDVALDSMIMSPEQSVAALQNGYVQMVIDSRNLEPHTA